MFHVKHTPPHPYVSPHPTYEIFRSPAAAPSSELHSRCKVTTELLLASLWLVESRFIAILPNLRPFEQASERDPRAGCTHGPSARLRPARGSSIWQRHSIAVAALERAPRPARIGPSALRFFRPLGSGNAAGPAGHPRPVVGRTHKCAAADGPAAAPSPATPRRLPPFRSNQLRIRLI